MFDDMVFAAGKGAQTAPAGCRWVAWTGACAGRLRLPNHRAKVKREVQCGGETAARDIAASQACSASGGRAGGPAAVPAEVSGSHWSVYFGTVFYPFTLLGAKVW